VLIPRPIGVAIVLALVCVVVSAQACAEEWDTIAPGKSTVDAVRAQFGDPTKQTTQKLEGYDTTQWIYEGERAPRGIVRLVVDFGLLTDSGYRPDTVRALTIEPAAGVFTRDFVEIGWGVPSRVGKQGDTPVFFYEKGLLVEFDKEGWLAERMTFTPPQPPAR
jgi:hypothetical protein